MEIKTIIHICRDCESTDLAPKAILCPRCKAAAEEKRKVRKREKAYVLYHAIRKIKKAPKPRPPHPCATSGCEDLPPTPPTSLKWLDKFSGWAGSGMSYADYQKAEMEKQK